MVLEPGTMRVPPLSARYSSKQKLHSDPHTQGFSAAGSSRGVSAGTLTDAEGSLHREDTRVCSDVVLQLLPGIRRVQVPATLPSARALDLCPVLLGHVDAGDRGVEHKIV